MSNKQITYSLIAAHSTNKVIGKNGKIPWKVPMDLKRFKELTENKIVVMGRKTYESIGKPLKNRINIVLTSDMKFADSFTFSRTEKIGMTSVSGVIQLCRHLTNFQPDDNESCEIMVIGGEQIYKAFMPLATKMYITEIGVEIANGDAFFPSFESTQWQEKEKTDHVESLGLLEGITHHIEIPFSYKLYEI